MTCSAWVRSPRALASLAAWIVLLGAFGLQGSAGADETPLLVAGAVFESPTLTVAPIVALRLPLGRDAVTVSQIGWTTGVAFEAPRDAELRWDSTLALTPIRAHLSHGVFAPNGKELPAEEFDDTAVRVTTGAAWGKDHVRVFAHGVGGKEWLSGVAPPLATPFRTVFGGAEMVVVLEDLRGEDIIASRIDGVRVSLRAEGLVGERTWGDADVTLSLGRRVGPAFARLDAGAFYVTLDNPVTDFLIGGSWDILGSAALYGHPLGAFRLPAGAAATAGLDIKTIGPIEVGARASALAGTPVPHEGLGALVRGDVSGIAFFAGVGTADAAAFHGDVARSSIFAGASGALLFLP